MQAPEVLARDVPIDAHFHQVRLGQAEGLLQRQKQRATLARALIMDPPVLILDDCLSSVDAQTEAEILHGLRAILKEKTCLIISHRISAVREADEILVLDEGAIIERGNHDELIRRGGVYAELCQQQRLSEELEQI